MPVLNVLMPVTDAEAARQFARDVQGDRADDFDQIQKKSGTTRETWFLSSAPDGTSVVSVWFECDDLEKAAASMTDGSPESEWFRQRVIEVSGIDPTDAIGAEPEQLLDWSA
jgi:hypothetical protein